MRTLLKIFTQMMIIGLMCSCKPDYPDALDTSVPIHRPLSSDAIRVELVDFELLRVSSDSGMEFTGHPVDQVKMLSNDSLGQHTLADVKPTVISSSQTMRMIFSFDVRLPVSPLEPHLVVLLLGNGVSVAAKETTIALYKYPYREARLVATRSQITTAPFAGSFQDIWLDKDKLYYHLIGPHGIGVLDLKTRISKELVDAGGGDHLAGGNGFLFFDFGHSNLLRYNLDLNKIDWNVDKFHEVPYMGYSGFAGLEVIGNVLYAFTYEHSGHSLKTFSMDGTLLDSIPYSGIHYHMTIHDGIVYSTGGWAPPRFSRFDLATKTFLPEVLAPSGDFEGFKIIGDSLYWSDYGMKMVGVIPFSALRLASTYTGNKNFPSSDQMRWRE